MVGQDDRQLYICNVLGVEKGSEQRVSLVEHVIDESKKLYLHGDLIGRVQVDQPIAGHLGVLVSIVADEILPTYDLHVRTDSPLRRGHVVKSQFTLVQRNARDPIARYYVNIAV